MRPNFTSKERSILINSHVPTSPTACKNDIADPRATTYRTCVRWKCPPPLTSFELSKITRANPPTASPFLISSVLVKLAVTSAQAVRIMTRRRGTSPIFSVSGCSARLSDAQQGNVDTTQLGRKPFTTEVTRVGEPFAWQMTNYNRSTSYNPRLLVPLTHKGLFGVAKL